MDAVGPFVYRLGSFALVGALWGCTNPLLKEGSSSSVRAAEEERSKQAEQQLSLIHI